MKKDIKDRKDIELLVNVFYEKAITDKQPGFVFRKIARENWSNHLPAMYDFWENIILFTGNYAGNTMNLHKYLNQITPLNKTHFDQWNILFIDTVDELFEGEKANLTKQRAINISGIIKDNILKYRSEINNIY